MFGPTSNLSSKSTNLSFNLSKKVAGNKAGNNLIQVYFKGEDRPVLSVISTELKSNVIKIYKCLTTCTYVLVKIEDNKIYRVTGLNLIAIPINNIDVNWELVCIGTNLNELQIKELYREFKVK